MSASHILEAKERLVAWRIDDLDTLDSGITSKEFMIGKWYWQLECEKYHKIIVIKLKPKNKSLREQSLPNPIASFFLRVLYPFGSPRLSRYEVTDREISNVDGGAQFRVNIGTLNGKIPITISLEFLDLKVALENDGKYSSIWDEECSEKISSNVLQDIYPDVVINTMDGSIEAHLAVLASNSPVFKTMYSNNYKEKETLTLDIKHMSSEACKAMISFIYGKMGGNELHTHKMELVAVAHMYEMVELKNACEASLCEDIGAKNVFERLKCASMYELPDLESTCLFYLVKMGTIFELRQDCNTFLHEADLIAKLLNACLDAW